MSKRLVSRELPVGVPGHLNELEVAELLGLSPRTLQNWRLNGEGPPFGKFGRSVRYSVATVEAWAAGREETLRPSPRLVLCGAGHDALPLHSMAQTLGWDVQVIDWRPAQASAHRFPGAGAHVLAPEALGGLPLEQGCAVVVMSHHLIYDGRVLEAALRSALPAYIGVLGPAKRTKDLLAMLPKDLPLARLHAPVGLALGGEGPAAVALSILSEIHAVLHGARATPMTKW